MVHRKEIEACDTNFSHREDVELKDVAATVYGNSVLLEVQEEREVLTGDVDTLNMSDDKEGAENSVTRYMVTVIWQERVTRTVLRIYHCATQQMS